MPALSSSQQANSGQPLAFRLVDIDYYLAKPLPGLDVCYSQLEGTAVEQVPVIRVFGSTPARQKVCMHMHRVSLVAAHSWQPLWQPTDCITSHPYACRSSPICMCPTQTICQMMRLMVSSCSLNADVYNELGRQLQQAQLTLQQRDTMPDSPPCWQPACLRLTSCLQRDAAAAAAAGLTAWTPCCSHAFQSMTRLLPAAQAFLRHLAHGIELALSQRLEPGSTPKQVSTLGWTALSREESDDLSVMWHLLFEGCGGQAPLGSQ